MVGQRHKRWHNIEPSLGHHIALAWWKQNKNINLYIHNFVKVSYIYLINPNITYFDIYTDVRFWRLKTVPELIGLNLQAELCDLNATMA